VVELVRSASSSAVADGPLGASAAAEPSVSRLACNAHWTGPTEDAFVSGIEKDERTE
jgi:hypothetical protein